MSKIELLAPAGDLYRAKIAILYGADAVYVGGKKFSLRSRASNFTIDDIAEAVLFAKEHQAKIFVTVNIIPHKEDLEGLSAYLRELADIGVSAIICSSMQVVKTAKAVAPNMEVHLSTQQSVTNSEAIAFFKNQQVDRIVLARELSMHEIAMTSERSSLPLEVFIHGGMCANYSGRCTLSNFMTLRDANRGGCAHSCRWFYQLYHDQNEITTKDSLFTMAACDLLALKHITNLIDLNIVSLKIEGRMKSAYYIAAVVKTYRMLIDEYYKKGEISDERLAWYQSELAKAENRPATDGYLSGLPREDMVSALIKTPASQEYIGTIVDIKEDLALLEVRNRFEYNDLLEVLSQDSENRTFVVDYLRDMDDQELTVCNRPMQLVWLKPPIKLKINDMIRRGYKL
ncbi:MAG: U32 family peptidase [Erysipelotrichaceae bacterium]|nr:U32 family peptidase [Erysipelotrichaceae bacterium]